MFGEAANRLNIPVIFLDPASSSPAKQIVAQPDYPHLTGSFTSADHIRQLADQVDVLTVEIEHVDADVLLQIRQECASTGGRSGKGVAIHPAPEVLLVIQDKLTQKQHLSKCGLPLADYLPIDSASLAEAEQSVQQAITAFGLPLMLKSRTLAYDGKGNYLLRTVDDLPTALKALGNGTRPLYAEKFAPFTREIAVMVVRDAQENVDSYPAVETIHRDNICHLVHAPLRARSKGLSKRAEKVAKEAVAALGPGAVGVFGVEMFDMPDGSLACLYIYYVD